MRRYVTNIVTDGNLASALINFRDVCEEHAVELGLGPADLAEIAAMADGFQDDLFGWVAAKAQADSALRRKDDRKTASRNTAAKWARIFRANPEIPDGLLAKLMLAPHRTPGVHSDPTSPDDVILQPDGNGTVLLRWERNGNNARTVFQIESRRSGEPWTVMAVSTRTRFRFQWPVGEYGQFRVRAIRNNRMSHPSVPAILGSPPATLPLPLAA